ncbi:hypothetical protein JNUCC1_00694 [Lentibacillus sp. JNUCC-1]|nr:hypothetical protein [Lentibacillus sp. JNUCC-1]
MVPWRLGFFEQRNRYLFGTKEVLCAQMGVLSKEECRLSEQARVLPKEESRLSEQKCTLSKEESSLYKQGPILSKQQGVLSKERAALLSHILAPHTKSSSLK